MVDFPILKNQVFQEAHGEYLGEKNDVFSRFTSLEIGNDENIYKKLNLTKKLVINKKLTLTKRMRAASRDYKKVSSDLVESRSKLVGSAV